MKCLISKGFKYLVALFIILSCVSVRAMAKETNDTADQSNRITEKGNASKDETFDTTDELVSNDPKKSISSQDLASDKGKNEASSTKDSVKTEYTFEDSKIKVKAVLKKADAVSDQAELKVKEILENTTEYKKYENALNKKDNAYSNVLLYDISFMLNGKEVEPADGFVKVSMEFKDKQLSDDLKLKSANDLKIIHFKDNNVNKQETLQTTTNVKNGTTSFETKSFSTYAVVTENETKKSVCPVYGFSKPDYGYGVTAEYYYQSGDTETNVYVDHYDSDVKELGSSNNYSNAGGYDFIGALDNFPDGLDFYKLPVKLYLGTSAYDTYLSDKTKFKANGKQMLDSFIEKNEDMSASQQLTKMSEAYSSVLNNISFDDSTTINSNSFTIDLRKLPKGTYAVKFSGNKIDPQSKIYINQGQHLIFYCTTSGYFESDRYKIAALNDGKDEKQRKFVESTDYVADTNTSDDWKTEAVSFYMPNVTTLHFPAGTCGIFVAPKASMTKGSSCGGVIGVKSFGTSSQRANGEWHYHNHNLPSPTDIQFEVKKQFTNDKWPNSGYYKLNLTAVDKAPLPSSGTSLDLSKTKTNGQFGKIIYSADKSKIGQKEYYEYKIYEDKGSVEKVTYDSTVYNVKVEVTYDTDGSALVTNTSYKRVKDGKALDDYWVPFTIGYQFTFINSIENEHKLSLQVNKKDETGRSLTGAVFNLKKDGDSGDGETIDTNNQSIANFSNLVPYSTYTLTETKAPVNYKASGPWKVETTDDSIKVYLLSDSEENIAIKKGNEDYAFTVNIKNDLKKFGFQLRKTDESTNKLITGNPATFTLTTIKSIDSLTNEMSLENDLQVLETTENGFVNVTDKLIAGKSYYLEETNAPKGYNKNGPWIIKVSDTGAEFYTVKNTDRIISDKNEAGNPKANAENFITYTVSDKKTEYTLPSTGGNGTKTLYMIGTLLSILGVIYVVFKKGKGGLLRKKKNL